MNKKTKIAIIAVIALVLVTIGITYAYWLITRTQTGENVITTGCLDISLNGENDITLSNQFPISDEEGMNLTPYTFTVTNNCNTSVDYHVNLESIGDSLNSISSDSLKAVLNTNTPRKLYDYVGSDTTISDAYEAYTLGYGTLTAKDTEGSTASYELRLWIDADAQISEMNKTYTGKISVSVGQGISVQGTSLASLILEDAEANSYLKTETPVFSTAPADGEYGLYKADDDLGDSYYFRGDVENNYVKLGTWKVITAKKYAVGTYKAYDTLEACEADADVGYPAYGNSCTELAAAVGEEMYWRIVRINGDGSIRLVYDGTEAVENGVDHVAVIDRVGFGNNYNYTYKSNEVETDSTVKTMLDAWYNNNIKADYAQYIADNIFCNDRSDLDSDGVSDTTNRVKNNNPTLICAQKADKYTTSSSMGNGLLTEPVGLLTADEFIYAGVGGSYLDKGMYMQWTMTPNFNTNSSDVYMNTGTNISSYGWASATLGVRPVINLKADVLFEGNGTIDSPYEIVME